MGLTCTAYTLVPHSLHSYFLLPGDAYTPYIYTVERLRDGKSFAMRRVIARQKGQAVFHMSVSFQVREAGFTHQHPMPRDVPPPESVPSQEELAARYKDDPRVPEVGVGLMHRLSSVISLYCKFTPS
jgi:acyl-CoA thioesterase-2